MMKERGVLIELGDISARKMDIPRLIVRWIWVRPTSKRVVSISRRMRSAIKREFDKSWEDIKKAQDLEYKIPHKFLDDLRKVLGKQN
jgi:hypothetical protein